MAGILPPAGGNFPNNKFIPSIWSKKVLLKFYAESVLSLITNTDYAGEFDKKGQTVTIRREPRVSVYDHTPGNAIPMQNVIDESVDLSIDYDKVSACHLPDEVADFSDLNVQALFQGAMAKAHSETLEEIVLSSVYASAGTTLTSAGIWTTAKNPTKDFAAAGAALSTKKIGMRNRFALLHPNQVQYLMQEDANFAQNSGNPRGALIDGWVARYAGFDIYQSPLVAGAGTAGNPYKSIFGTKEAIGLAQIVKNIQIKDVSDKLGKNLIGQTIFGFGVLQPDALVYLPGQVF